MPDVLLEDGYSKVNTPVNDRFHSYLVSISKNALFIQTHAKVMEKLYRVLQKDTRENSADAIRREHMELVSRMKSGDRDSACGYMRGHIRRTKERVLGI